MVGPRVLASQPPCNHLAVVVSQMREPAEPRDITGSEHTGARFERRGVDLQPAALCLGKAGSTPCFHVRPAARRNQQPIGRDHCSGLEVDDYWRAAGGWRRELRFDSDTRVSHHHRDTVGFEVWPERRSGLWLLETKERRSSFDAVQRSVGQ